MYLQVYKLLYIKILDPFPHFFFFSILRKDTYILAASELCSLHFLCEMNWTGNFSDLLW